MTHLVTVHRSRLDEYGIERLRVTPRLLNTLREYPPKREGGRNLPNLCKRRLDSALGTPEVSQLDNVEIS
jgi:hypothetical protein